MIAAPVSGTDWHPTAGRGGAPEYQTPTISMAPFVLWGLAMSRLPLLALFALASVHCRGTVTESPEGGLHGGDGDSGSAGSDSGAGGGTDSGHSFEAGCPGSGMRVVPAVHVAQPSACTMVAGYPADAAPTSCTSDTQCSDGGPALGGSPSSHCLHGECSTSACTMDDDCGDGGVCSCQGSTFGYAHTSFGNVCVPGNCRSDADCGPGSYCSPTLSGGPFYGIQGYYCHSCNDECTNDSDCGDGGCSYCAYDRTVGHWACSHSCAAG
jgi:hypothetical protein